MHNKKNPFVRLAKFICSFVFTLTVLTVAWLLYSTFDKASPLSVMPSGYTAFFHTDSMYDAVIPVLDVQAADTLLADPALVDYRPAFLSLRASGLKENKYVRSIFSCRADATLYTETESDFVAVLDLGTYSCVTRLADVIGSFLHIQNLEYIKTSSQSSFSYFSYKIIDEKKKSEIIFYIKPFHNLLVVSLNPQVLIKSFKQDYVNTYSMQEKNLLESSCQEPIRVTLNARQFTSSLLKDNNVLYQTSKLLSNESNSIITFAVANDSIKLKASFPFDEQELENSSLKPLLTKKSLHSSMIGQFTDSVQYYTLLNAGSLKELKESIFPIVQQKQDLQSLWNEGETWCTKLFSLSLEDLLFSWTGTEFSVLGMEGSSAPVFAIQIGDEQKRQQIFDKLTSSILIRKNTNLIVDGVRIPQLELPAFFRGLLKLFKIELPKPYYIVQNGYIYFSESPQNLAVLSSECREQKLISRNELWKKVSFGLEQNSSIGLYYNLERSIPFFLQNETLVTRLLRLYNIGCFDIHVEDNLLVCQLKAVSTNVKNKHLVPGFPFALQGSSDFYLQNECFSFDKNPSTVFFVDGENTIKSLELDSLKQHKLLLNESCTVTSAQKKCRDDGVLWAVTSNGSVYLLTRELNCVRGFPVSSGGVPACRGTSYGTSFVFPTTDGKIISVNEQGECSIFSSEQNFIFTSEASILEDNVAFYAKGFDGKIVLYKNNNFNEPFATLKSGGIGFSSPCLAKINSDFYVTFITQAGKLSVYKNNEMLPGFPVKVPGTFFTNVVYANESFFALSKDSKLYRIELNGTFFAVEVEAVSSAKQGFLSVQDETIFVSTDSNILYAFTPSLELISGYPVAGRGTPVLADVNGDGEKECLVLSLDKKLYAWNLK